MFHKSDNNRERSQKHKEREVLKGDVKFRVVSGKFLQVELRRKVSKLSGENLQLESTGSVFQGFCGITDKCCVPDFLWAVAGTCSTPAGDDQCVLITAQLAARPLSLLERERGGGGGCSRSSKGLNPLEILNR